MPHYSRLGTIVIDVPEEQHDPAGQLFCVVPEEAGSLDDANAQRWD